MSQYPATLHNSTFTTYIPGHGHCLTTNAYNVCASTLQPLHLVAVKSYSLTVNISNLRDTTLLPAVRILETRAVFVVTELVYVYDPIPLFRFCPKRWRNVALHSTSIVYHGLTGRLRNKENMNNTYCMERSPS